MSEQTRCPPSGHARPAERAPFAAESSVAVPRWLFHAALLIVSLWVLLAASDPTSGLVAWLVGLGGVLVLGVVWLCLLVGWLVERRRRERADRGGRWFLLAPAMVITVALLVLAGVPLRARWGFSRDSFQVVADEALDSGAPPVAEGPRRIGAYRVHDVEVVDSAVVFVLRRTSWAEDGFVYLSERETDPSQVIGATGPRDDLGGGSYTYSRGTD